MKKTIVVVAAVLLVAVLAGLSQTPSGPKYQVVFQMSEAKGDAWDSVLGHVTNLRKALEKDGVEVEVVFFGPGLDMLLKKNTEQEQRIKELSDAGVKFAACQNAMRFRHVKSEDLLPFATEVDSGVAELTRRQKAGWAYIH